MPAAADENDKKVRRRTGDLLQYDERLAAIQQAPQISQTEKSEANEWNRHHLSAALKLNQALVALNKRATASDAPP